MCVPSTFLLFPSAMWVAPLVCAALSLSLPSGGRVGRREALLGGIAALPVLPALAAEDGGTRRQLGAL
eukprot:scaffold107725_cov30-Tisochrysis_lutea.AAC.1